MTLLFNCLISAIVILFVLVASYDFINGLDQLQPVDELMTYVEQRFLGEAKEVCRGKLPPASFRATCDLEVPSRSIGGASANASVQICTLPELPEPPTETYAQKECLWGKVFPQKLRANLGSGSTDIELSRELVPEVTPNLESSPTDKIDFSTLPTTKLRQLCSDRGIRWRCVRGSKHLTKAEMVLALATRQEK